MHSSAIWGDTSCLSHKLVLDNLKSLGHITGFRRACLDVVEGDSDVGDVVAEVDDYLESAGEDMLHLRRSLLQTFIAKKSQRIFVRQSLRCCVTLV